MSDEIGAACARSLDALGNNRIRILDVPSGDENVIDVLCGLVNIAFDIHGETRCLGNGKTEVKGDDTRNATKTDEKTPSVVDGESAREGSFKDGVLVCSNDDDTDEGRSWSRKR